MNEVILSGRMVNDAEIKLTAAKKFYTYFGIAVKRDYKDETGKYPVDFFDCLAFNHTAKYIAEYGYKGREVIIKGNLKTRTYTNRKGEQRKIVEIKVLDVDLLGPSKQTYEKNKKESNKK